MTFGGSFVALARLQSSYSDHSRPDILLYHIFSGKYSSFEYLIKCQIPTLYHTSTLYHTPTLYHISTLYTLLFKYMIKCIKHGKIRIIGPRDNTAYDTDFAMYYSLYINLLTFRQYMHNGNEK